MAERMWYYVQQDQQIGPVSESELLQLLQNKSIGPDVHVWTDGMEQWQPAFQVPGLLGSKPVAGGRPTSVTVFSILNIIFGVILISCLPFAIIGLFMPQPEGAFETSSAMTTFSMIDTIVGFVFGIVLIASGIGLLNLKAWARKMAFAYGWCGILWAVIRIIANIMIVIGIIGQMGGEYQQAMITGGIIGGICGGSIWLIYPILLVVYMNRPYVIDACDR